MAPAAPPAAVPAPLSKERIEYTRDKYKEAASELAEARGSARQFVGVLGALVAVEGTLFLKTIELHTLRASLPVGVALCFHVHVLRLAVRESFGTYHWSRPPRFIEGLENTTRGKALGETGLIADEYREGVRRANEDADNLRATIGQFGKQAIVAFALGFGLTMLILLGKEAVTWLRAAGWLR